MLDLTFLKNQAPAIFAIAPADTVSGRYRFASTKNVLEACIENGIVPVRAEQAFTRTADKLHARHMVALRPAQYAEARAVVGELVPEVVIENAHTNQGGCAWRVYAAIYRFICANGATVSLGGFEDIRVPHSSRQIENILEGVFKVVDISNEAAEACMSWRSIKMSRQGRLEFAERAIALRWPENPPVKPYELLSARRWEDRGDDLFITYQQGQEDLTKGLNPRTKGRRAPRIRDINAIKLNKALFNLAQEYAK